MTFVFSVGVFAPGVLGGLGSLPPPVFGRVGIQYVNVLGQSVDFNDQEVTKLVPFLGGFGMAEYETLERRSPHQRGSTAVSSDPVVRIVEIPTMLMADNAIGIEGIYRNFARVLNPSPYGRDSAFDTGVLRITLLDGTVRWLKCVCVDGAGFSTDGFVGTDRRQHLFTFKAYDPDWYDPDANTVIFSGSGGGNNTFPQTFPEVFTTIIPFVGGISTINYDGTAPGEPLFTLIGPMLNPVIQNITTGKIMKFNGLIPSGGMLSVDTRFIYQHHDLTAYDTVYPQDPPMLSQSEYWHLRPGENRIIITADEPVPGGSAEMYFYNKYAEL